MRPDVNAVIHHHAPGSVSFGMGKIPMRPMNQSSRWMLDGIPWFDYRSIKLEGDRGWEQSNLIHTPARGQLVARTLGASPALLLVNHGAVVVGSSIYEAVGRSIYMPVGARSTARPRLDRKRAAACGASSQPRDGFNELGAERVAQHLLDLPIDLRADCHVIGCRRDHVLPENRESHPLEWLAAVCHDIADQLRRLGAGARRTSLTSPDTST